MEINSVETMINEWVNVVCKLILGKEDHNSDERLNELLVSYITLYC
jgi:hypothetical protein